jgi:hypothetical protein
MAAVPTGVSWRALRRRRPAAASNPDAGPGFEGLIHRGDQLGPLGLHLAHQLLEAPRHPPRLGELDLVDAPSHAALQHQIQLGAVAGAQDVGAPAGMGGNQLLDHEALPALTRLGMGQQVVVGLDSQQAVQQTAVAQGQLGGAHQALAEVGLQGEKPPQHERLLQHRQPLLEPAAAQIEQTRQSAGIEGSAPGCGPAGARGAPSGAGAVPAAGWRCHAPGRCG